MGPLGTGVLNTVGRTTRARRKDLSLTLGDLANRLGLATDVVSAIEHDEHAFDERTIAALARTLDFDVNHLQTRALFVARMRELRGFPHTGLSSPPPHPFHDDRPARVSRSLAEIETIAASMRKTLPVPVTGKISALSLFERLDEITLKVRETEEYRVDYAVRRLSHAVEARTRADPARRTIEVAMSPEAYREMIRGNPRILSTLCHEVGHLVLHREELFGPDEADTPTSELPSYARTEWQAHAFAAAFIAPLDQVLALHDENSSISPVDVHRRFGCSKAAAQRRLDTVEQLAPRRIIRFGDQLDLPLHSGRRSASRRV